MPFTAEYLNASFGSSRTGIGTVGLTLMKNDGTVSVARTTAGVVEEGGGVYGKANIAIPDDAASILWDTGGGTPLYAAEDLEPARKQAELEAKLPTGDIASPGDEMALVDDAITSAKYDESTAFPVKSDDAGATQIARTGADGDTLETLSDQIDGVPVAVRAAIMTYVLDGNILGITMEEALDFIRKVARNRLEQADGDTDNLVLFDDDGSTPLFQWDSKNKNGGNISQPTAAPARRIPS